MNYQTAKDCADLVIETLVEWGVISANAYGKMNENQREQLAEKLVAHCDE